MSSDHHVPWPIWAGVTLFAAYVAAGHLRDDAPPPAVDPLSTVGAGIVAPPAVETGAETPAPRPAPAPIRLEIHDQLGEGQLDEVVSVLIDGRPVGRIVVDAQTPSALLPVTLPEAGRYSYTVEAQATFVGSYGKPVRLVGAGQGMIDAADGKHFDLYGSISGGTWLVTLVDGSP